MSSTKYLVSTIFLLVISLTTRADYSSIDIGVILLFAGEASCWNDNTKQFLEMGFAYVHAKG